MTSEGEPPDGSLAKTRKPVSDISAWVPEAGPAIIRWPAAMEPVTSFPTVREARTASPRTADFQLPVPASQRQVPMTVPPEGVV